MEAVKYLLQAGATPTVVDRFGGTPIADAVREGHPAVQLMLYEAGSKMDSLEVAFQFCEAGGSGDVDMVSLHTGGCGSTVFDTGTALDWTCGMRTVSAVGKITTKRAIPYRSAHRIHKCKSTQQLVSEVLITRIRRHVHRLHLVVSQCPG